MKLCSCDSEAIKKKKKKQQQQQQQQQKQTKSLLISAWEQLAASEFNEINSFSIFQRFRSHPSLNLIDVI
jgi:hypothetical protein